MPTPHEHLAAFEAEKLGDDVERHNGKVEKGSGSRFAALDPEDKKRHAALEQLIEADAKVAQAQTALDAAIAHHAKVAERAGVEPDGEPQTEEEADAEDEAREQAETDRETEAEADKIAIATGRRP